MRSFVILVSILSFLMLLLNQLHDNGVNYFLKDKEDVFLRPVFSGSFFSLALIVLLSSHH